MKQRFLLLVSMLMLICTGALAQQVAKIGETQYESLLSALAAVNSQAGDDVVLEVLDDVSENIGESNFKFTKNLTITASAARKINFQQTAAYGYLQPVEGKILTIGENITIDGLGNFGPDKVSGTAIVNGTVKANYFRARGAANNGGVGKLIVNGTIGAISGMGESYLRFGNEGYAEFNGTLTDATAEGLEPMDTKLYVNGGENAKIVFNNVYVQMLKAADPENTNLSFELNNSKVKFDKADYSSLNVTGTLKMDNKSTFDVGAGYAMVTIAAGATAEIVPGAKIIANGLQNNGTIKIDLTGAEGKTLLIDYNGNQTLTAANYGHIVNANNEDFATYVEDNDLYADVASNVAAKVGSLGYTTFAAALDAVQVGETLTLTKDLEVDAMIQIAAGKDFTLDLNGKKISPVAGTQISGGLIGVHNGATLTIDDSSTEKNGTITSGTDGKVYAAVQVTVKGDAATTPAKLVVNNGNLEGFYYAIAGNGSRHNTQVTINGGSLKGLANNPSTDDMGYAIFHPQDGQLTVNGGTLEGVAAAVEMRAGKINVTGGTFTATATEFKEAWTGSGSTIVGAALAVSQHSTNKDIAVNITGGEFNGIKALYEVDLNPATGDKSDNISMTVTSGTFTGSVASQNVSKFISGGSFSEAPALATCEEGFAPGLQEDGTFAVNNYAVTVLDENGNVKASYKKITAPTNAELAQPHTDLSLFNDDKKTIKVEENDVIVFLKDISASVQWGTTTNNVKFSVDLNGHTWTGTPSLYYDGSTITVKNGKIVGGVQVKTMTFNVEENTEVTGAIKLDSQAQTTSINVAGKIGGITDEGSKSNSSRTITFAETANVNGQLALNMEQQDTRKITYNVNITCGTFNTNGYTILLSEKNTNNVTISGGTFVTGGNGPLNIVAKVITGGTFDTDVKAYCAEGYETVKNSDNTWTVKYIGKRVLKVYKSNGTTENLSKSLFEEYLVANPNAVAIVSSENAAEVAGVKNVIVDYAVGTNGGHYYECANFVLTDPATIGHLTKADFYTPVDFVAVSGSYTRAATNSTTITACLPFAIDNSSVENADILTFAYHERIYDEQGHPTRGSYAYFNKRNHIDAGTPCMIYSASKPGISMDFNNTRIVANPDNSGNLQGTFKYASFAGFYGVKDQDGHTVMTEVTNGIVAFRSALSLEYDANFDGGSGHTQNTTNDARVDYLEIAIIGEDGVITGIDGIEMENNVAENAKAEGVYNLNGQRVSKATKGLYIINGKKTIVK